MKRISRQLALTLGLLGSITGCAEIQLRDAMESVQKRHQRLQERLRQGKSFESREAALDLRRALEAPAVAKHSPFSGNPDYEALLQAAIGTTERVRQVAGQFEPGLLGDLAREVSSSCDACHQAFRQP